MRLYDVTGMQIKMESDICHHGVIGQKWGRRRYQNLDGTLTPLGKKRLEAKQRRAVKKEQKAELKALKKEYKQVKKEQDEQRKFEEKKEKLLSKGSREDVYKNADMFTDKELQDFANRQRLLDQLKPADDASRMISDINAPTKTDVRLAKAAKFAQRAGNIMTTTTSLLDSVNKGAKIVNNIAGKEVVPEFDLAKRLEKEKKAKEKADKEKKEARNKKIWAMTPDQIAKNYSKFTTEELVDLKKRADQIARLDKANSEYSKTRTEKAAASDKLRESLMETRKRWAYDINTAKNFVSSMESVNLDTYREWGGDISAAKKAVENMFDMPIGEVSSKWYPPYEATYK